MKLALQRAFRLAPLLCAWAFIQGCGTDERALLAADAGVDAAAGAGGSAGAAGTGGAPSRPGHLRVLWSAS